MGPTVKFSDALGLQPVSKQTVACERHGPFEQSTTMLGGREIKSRCPKCALEEDIGRSRQHMVQFETDRRAAREGVVAARAAEILATSQLPKRFLGRTFETYVAETPEQRAALTACREYAETFDSHLDRGTGLLLSGAMGNGKTHLAGAIMQAIMPRRRALFTTVPELIRAVRDTWRRDSKHSTTQVVESMRALDLLVVDEIGVQTGTDGEQVILYDVLDGRYRDCKPTVMITNLDMKTLKSAIGDRLYDRLRETSRHVRFDWDSRRPMMRESH